MKSAEFLYTFRTLVQSPCVLGIIAMAATACTGGSAAPGDIDPCLSMTSGFYPATSGGDHGPPWPGISGPILDGTGGPRLDLSQEPWPDLPDLPDLPAPGVVDWQEDPQSQVQYRRVTEFERAHNDWSGDLLLVALEDEFVASLSRAAPEVNLVLPLADAYPLSLQEDLPLVSVRLVHQSSRDFAGLVEHHVADDGAVKVTARRPVFHAYSQPNLEWGTVDDTAVHLFAQDEGGIVAVGATYGRTFWLEGPLLDTHGRIVLEIEPESGHEVFLLHTRHGAPLRAMMADEDGVASQVLNQRRSSAVSSFAASTPTRADELLPAINQCTDGLNNDPQLDDNADGCDFSCMPHPDFGTDAFPGVVPIWEYATPFAVVGDAQWCSNHPSDWEDLLHAYGRTAEQMLNWVQAPPTFPGPRVPPFRLVGLYCWVFSDLEAAAACHHDGSCPAGYEGYPLQGVGSNWNQVLKQAWKAADAWAHDAVQADAADVVHPLQHVAVVTGHKDPEQSFSAIGLAILGINNSFTTAGGAVVLGAEFGVDFNPVTLGWAMAHEFGHTYGLMHDPTSFDGADGFMHSSGGPVPRLGENVESNVDDYEDNPPTKLVQYEAWVVASKKQLPRPVGFSYVGCGASAIDCPKGLTCINTIRGSICLP